MAHRETFYRLHMGSRGRVVLPISMRRDLKLESGDELVVTVEPDGSLRIASTKQVVRRTRGIYKSRAGNRSLVDELIAERRKED